MTPPGASHETAPRAVSLRSGDGTALAGVQTMRTRAQFLRAARALRQGTGSLLLQARDRGDGSDRVNVGFTCSKKVGNAVARNRAKRRLRHLAAEILPGQARPGWDYVLVGRPDKTATLPFDQLRRDLGFALGRVHARA